MHSRWRGGNRLFRLGREECVGQGDRAHVLQLGHVDNVRIDIKDDRHVERLARLQRRVGEAKAFDLVEIGAGQLRRHIERSLAGGRRVEFQRSQLGRLVEESRGPGIKEKPERQAQIARRIDELRLDVSNWFEKSPVQVLVVVPPGLKAQVEEINRALAAGDRTSGPRELPAHPMLLENSADEKSAIAFRRVRDVFAAWEDEVLKSRLEQAELPLSISAPVVR